MTTSTTTTCSIQNVDAAAAASCTTAATTTTNHPGVHRILALYKFVHPQFSPDELPAFKQSLQAFCLQHGVRGSLLLASEGINGTISYPFDHTTTTTTTTTTQDNPSGEQEQEHEDVVVAHFQSLFPGLRIRLSHSPQGHVFYRLKIKVKQDILTCRVDDLSGGSIRGDHSQSHTDTSSHCHFTSVCLDPTQQVGTYVPPGPAWDALLQDPDCLVIDARNDYEVRMGTFRNAVNPHTEIFSELIPWMHCQLQTRKPPKIAMFCTGGIRCEKASAAALDLVQQYQQQQQQQQQQSTGSKETKDDDNNDNNNNNNNNSPIPVYHLEGGILAYLDQVPASQSLFEGACYVFDQRVAVTHGLQPCPELQMCHACRAPLTPQEQEGHPDFVAGQQCRYCKSKTTAKQQERFAARQHQIQLAQQKGWLHIHDPKEKVLSVLAQTGKQKFQHNKDTSCSANNSMNKEKTQEQAPTESNIDPAAAR